MPGSPDTVVLRPYFGYASDRAGRVRCLGVGPEHTFDSADVSKERICLGCRAKIKAASPMFERMVRMQAEV